MSKSILVTGCFHSLNSGVMAMVESVIQNFEDHKIYVLSSDRYYAVDSKRYGIYDRVELVKTPWRSGSKLMKIVHLLLSLVGITIDKRLKSVLKEVDFLIDISGDTISSDYNTLGIVLSSAHFLAAKGCGTRIILGPQTLGPFEGTVQNYFAKRIFNAADKIFVREKESYQFLKGFKQDFKLVADLAFLLKERENEKKIDIPENTIAFGVSGLLVNKNQTESSLYEGIMNFLLSKGYNVLLVTHVNLHDADDLDIGRQIKETFKDDDRVIFGGENFRSSEWKKMIGKCKGIVSGRMHPIVLGLSNLVPALNLSYNHKSKGVVENRFSPYGSLVDTRENNSDQIIERVSEFISFIESEEFDVEKFRELRDSNEQLSKSFIQEVKKIK